MLAFLDASNIVELAYMAASLLFILGILKLGKVKTSKQGNLWAAYGMALAIAATMLLLVTRGDWDPREGEWTYQSHALAVGAMALGSVIGWWMAIKVPMTSMPEFVAFFNGLGGAASMFVALAEVPRAAERGQILATEGADFAIADSLAVIIGAITLTGSLIAYAKLAGKLNKSRIGPLGSQGVNALLGVACIGLRGVGRVFRQHADVELWLSNGLFALAALLLGVGLTLPIGGADMPVAIALLNSYSGIAGMTTGFILKNNLLIVAGSLVGASGIILTQIMCKAMNRSLGNVLLGGMGEAAAPPAGRRTRATPRSSRPRRKNSPRCSTPRRASSLCPVTDSPSPRRNTRCANSRDCSRKRAVWCAMRSIPSRAACPGT